MRRIQTEIHTQYGSRFISKHFFSNYRHKVNPQNKLDIEEILKKKRMNTSISNNRIEYQHFEISRPTSMCTKAS